MSRSNEGVSFDELARDVSPAVLRYLRRLLGDEALAEDLLQDTLIRMARGLDSFGGHATVRTWAFSIATRAVADHFRKPERRARIVDMSEADEVPDPARSVDDGLVIDEMNDCVRQVIDGLPDDYRAALVLHDIEGLTAQQTAEVCGCTVPTAKIRIHRSRERLRKALQQQCELYRDAENVLRCERKP